MVSIEAAGTTNRLLAVTISPCESRRGKVRITMIWGWAVAILVFGGLSVSVAIQIIPSLRRVRRASGTDAASRSWPRAEILLSLKGTDPFLDRCLDRLAAQDYPDFQVTVVVDSLEDPAWEQAVAAQNKYGRDVVNLLVRSHCSTTCTRKVSNLLSAFSTLSPAVEVVALCDGDAIVHPTWLKELVAGLDDPEIAAVSANRWYAPPASGIADLSRHYWNAMAVPATQRHHILWGGSLAMRRLIVDEPAFLTAFARGFADDTMIACYLHQTGRAYRVLGSTYVINSESTTVRSYWNFLVRQMLCVRLHHPKWRPIFAEAVVLALALGVVFPVLKVSGMGLGVVGLAGIIAYGLTLLSLASLYEARLRASFPDQRALHVPVTTKRILMTVPALVLTAVIYPAATMVAACTRRHLWRGVEYRLVGGKVVAAIDHSERPVPRPANGLRRPKFLGRARRKAATV